MLEGLVVIQGPASLLLKYLGVPSVLLPLQRNYLLGDF